MLDQSGWLRCAHCGHLVNPRSERCDTLHQLCTPEGCQPGGPSRIAALIGASLQQVESLTVFPATPTRMVDLASYQAGINLSAVRAAGYGAVNIKTSQGTWYQFGDGPAYADAARELGMAVSAFHWLDNSASGADQARYAYQRYQALDAQAMQCDNEDSARPASWSTTRDFVRAWADLAGHLPYMYTGDWWATSAGRGDWDVYSLTPWLMAAPNVGYLGSYPGDDSSHWYAGYWGYEDLALMQFAVASIAGAGGGALSQTAIRYGSVWAAITGGGADVALRDDPDAIWMLNRIQGMANMNAIQFGPEAGRVPPLVQAIQGLQAAAAGDEARDTATLAAVNALADLIKAGGGDVDVAAIRAAIDDAAGKQTTIVQALSAQVAELQQELAAYRRAEAEAAQAEADRLRAQ